MSSNSFAKASILGWSSLPVLLCPRVLAFSTSLLIFAEIFLFRAISSSISLDTRSRCFDSALLCRVSDRPVFLLEGELPSYRDLGPGIRGDDVRQLETSLARMGFDPGPEDGLFDGSTATAVAAPAPIPLIAAMYSRNSTAFRRWAS